MASTRRQRRREETLAEILAIAVDLMTADGVAAVSLAEVARRLGIQQPSLFKYFPSKLALYDALFASAARQVADVYRAAVSTTDPGLPASKGVDALARFAMANQALAQLLFWRPVPGFTPSETAYADAIAFTDAMTAVVAEAVERGQLHPDAASEEGLAVLSWLDAAGAMTQQLANEPGVPVEKGRFVALLPQLIDMFAAAYPASKPAKPAKRRGGRS